MPFTKTIPSLLEQILYFFILILAFLVPFNKSIPEISSVVFLLSIIYFLTNKDININILKQYKLILIAAALFFGWLILRSIIAFTNADIKNIFRYTGILFLPILILLSTTLLKEKKKLFYIIYSFISANLIIALYLLLKAVFTGTYWDVEFISLFPTLWYPGVMAFSIPTGIYLILTEKINTGEKIVLGISLVILICCIYMASRRGIILSVAGAVGLIAAVKIWSFKRITYKIIFGIGIIALFSALLSNPRFKAIKNYNDYNYDIRLTMWVTAFKMVTVNPFHLFLGYGIKKGYEEYNKKLKKISYFPEWMKKNFNSSHNDFLDIFIMFGLIGLILFLSLLFTSICYIAKTRNLVFAIFILMSFLQFIFGSYYFWFRSGKFSYFFLFSLFLLLNDNYPSAKKQWVN